MVRLTGRHIIWREKQENEECELVEETEALQKF